MIKVWLDDVRPVPAGWVWVKSAEAALALLEAGEVETMSLDHDLGMRIFINEDGIEVASEDRYAKDGTWLVNQMIRNNLWPKHKPNVHSANPVGAQRMKSLIDKYGPYV